jgi:hypothetical protein
MDFLAAVAPRQHYTACKMEAALRAVGEAQNCEMRAELAIAAWSQDHAFNAY